MIYKELDIWNTPKRKGGHAPTTADVSITINKRGKQNTAVRMAFYNNALDFTQDWEFAVASSIFRVSDMIYILKVDRDDEEIKGYHIVRDARDHRKGVSLTYAATPEERFAIEREWLGTYKMHRVKGEDNIFYIKKEERKK